MARTSPQDKEFLDQLIALVESQLGDEEFGVAELADEMHMSRSNLLRRVKKACNLSVSQLINQIRLERAMEMLRNSTLNVSEISHQVGFNSPSYFIKCFREYYGYPPGEAGKHAITEPVEVEPLAEELKGSKLPYWIGAAGLLILLIVGLLLYKGEIFGEQVSREKSIAVLPFKNDSADSTNVYLINGLMDATLNNLQKIKDLRVLSRTSSEKYRESHKSIPEISEELQVSYLIEGSGQKIGESIVLNIQLIDGASDKHLWSKQYRREASDIFTLQQDISKDIAEKIQAIITPEEQNRIEKVPTENLKAYDSFLKGLNLLNKGGDDNLLSSVGYFKEAIKEDKSFGLAYAYAAVALYYHDVFREEKTHLEEMSVYADQAVLYDPTLDESLRAKALYYMLKKEYAKALPYLEKGLEYNPNSDQILILLANYYSMYMPNTGKYLEYAIQGLRLDIAAMDSASASFRYLEVGNGLIQTGFVDESLDYIDLARAYFPDNAFAGYVRAFISYAKTKDLRDTRNQLKAEFAKDSSRIDILQDLGKVSYYLREYDSAFLYYDRLNQIREQQKLDVYVHENMIIGVTYVKVGEIEKGQELIQSYKDYIESNQTIYRPLGLSTYYAYRGDYDKALDYLRLFSKEDNILFWVILFLPEDPTLDKFKENPEFKEIWAGIEKKFWDNNSKIRLQLEEEGLL
ncbi:helix-turn-helix domain-containing protein [Algoriphagus chordae]|uniref:TolB-like protein n=1 Tax=Algoriphagus chordae TaxID=237019 RepID=A0A2W7RU97_9BACT|nr:helix-turn-helix domain-containing protein [Algoriphagus chordae]PZX58199.1 TolB-like protein [Algoriphagus chordae]